LAKLKIGLGYKNRGGKKAGVVRGFTVKDKEFCIIILSLRQKRGEMR